MIKILLSFVLVLCLQAISYAQCEDVSELEIFQVIATFDDLVSTCMENSEFSKEECLTMIKEEENELIKSGVGSLANVCENSQLCLGLVVFVPYTEGGIHYDDKRIKAPSGKCISYDGVYRYTTNNGASKTVPILRMIDR